MTGTDGSRLPSPTQPGAGSPDQTAREELAGWGHTALLLSAVVGPACPDELSGVPQPPRTYSILETAASVPGPLCFGRLLSRPQPTRVPGKLIGSKDPRSDPISRAFTSSGTCALSPTARGHEDCRQLLLNTYSCSDGCSGLVLPVAWQPPPCLAPCFPPDAAPRGME